MKKLLIVISVLLSPLTFSAFSIDFKSLIHSFYNQVVKEKEQIGKVFDVDVINIDSKGEVFNVSQEVLKTELRRCGNCEISKIELEARVQKHLILSKLFKFQYPFFCEAYKTIQNESPNSGKEYQEVCLKETENFLSSFIDNQGLKNRIYLIERSKNKWEEEKIISLYVQSKSRPDTFAVIKLTIYGEF